MRSLASALTKLWIAYTGWILVLVGCVATVSGCGSVAADSKSVPTIGPPLVGVTRGAGPFLIGGRRIWQQSGDQLRPYASLAASYTIRRTPASLYDVYTESLLEVGDQIVVQRRSVDIQGAPPSQKRVGYTEVLSMSPGNADLAEDQVLLTYGRVLRLNATPRQRLLVTLDGTATAESEAYGECYSKVGGSWQRLWSFPSASNPDCVVREVLPGPDKHVMVVARDSTSGNALYILDEDSGKIVARAGSSGDQYLGYMSTGSKTVPWLLWRQSGEGGLSIDFLSADAQLTSSHLADGTAVLGCFQTRTSGYLVVRGAEGQTIVLAADSTLSEVGRVNFNADQALAFSQDGSSTSGVVLVDSHGELVDEDGFEAIIAVMPLGSRISKPDTVWARHEAVRAVATGDIAGGAADEIVIGTTQDHAARITIVTPKP